MLLVASLVSGQQVVEQYPKGQENYHGGEKQFYKDFQKVLLEQNLKPCENKVEVYTMRVLVYPDASIKFIKPDDEKEVEDNQCTFKMMREAFKYMDGWKPAVINGQKVIASTSFMVYPNDMFDNYKEGYVLDIKKAEFKGGIDAFRRKVYSNINVRPFIGTGKVRVAVTFTVEKDGSVQNVEMEESSYNEEFDKMVINSILWASRKGWKPAMINGNVPTKFRFRLPLTFNFE